MFKAILVREASFFLKKRKLVKQRKLHITTDNKVSPVPALTPRPEQAQIYLPGPTSAALTAYAPKDD